MRIVEVHVQVDVRSPFRNVAIWCAVILNRLASSCTSVLQDSGQLLSELHGKFWPSGAFLVSADLVEYFESIDIFQLRACIKRFIFKDFGSKDADYVNKLVALYFKTSISV